MCRMGRVWEVCGWVGGGGEEWGSVVGLSAEGVRCDRRRRGTSHPGGMTRRAMV